MSGVTSICLQQQHHNATGATLAGGLLYSMQAGTLNPQNAFRTAALAPGTEYPNPIKLDASGRVPLMFYADGVVRLILTDAQGIAQFDYDNVPVIGSSGGGSGVDTTDPTRLFSTGMMMLRYGTGPVTGFVRGNGLTIGDGISPATEMHDDICQALFQYFWNNDPFLAVSPSRGGSAVDDWNAHKTITTPDYRGHLIGGLDGMGAARANRLSAAKWDVLGQAFGGTESGVIGANHMPPHTHVVKIPAGEGQHLHAGTMPYKLQTLSTSPGGATQVVRDHDPVETTPLTIDNATLPELNGTAQATGGGEALPIVQPSRLLTVYFRL